MVGLRVMLAGLALTLTAAPLAAQVTRLPQTDESRQFRPFGQRQPREPIRVASHPDSSEEILELPGEQGPTPADRESPEPDLPPGARNGVFQKLIFDNTWLARTGGSRGFGMNDMDLRMVLGFPAPTKNSPLLVTPGFAVRYLDGPASPDLPPRVYDAYTQFRWMHPVSPRLGIDLAVTPGIYSDFQQGTDNGIRITGHGAAMWTFNPNFKVILGAAYLDRDDVGVIPVGGILWTPRDGLAFELVSPRPRIATRFIYRGDVEYWSYVAGEFGGGIWAIRRADGSNDVFDYRDWRAILGVERKAVNSLATRVEVAYIFSRKILYESDTPDFEPSSTVMVRGGVTY